MTIDLSNFYLNTPMKRYEYVKLRLSDIPEEIIAEYKLRESGKITANDFVYIEVHKGMYGLPQAGILAQDLLEERLNDHGYRQVPKVPGLWKHDWPPVQFTLVVDDFGVKYVGKKHAEHLISVLDNNYDLDVQWEGKKYIGITLDWDYVRK